MLKKTTSILMLLAMLAAWVQTAFAQTDSRDYKLGWYAGLSGGDRVRLPDWGMMKLEIESAKVDDPKTFRAKKHIRGVRIHFLPKSDEGTQELYEGITFEKEK